MRVICAGEELGIRVLLVGVLTIETPLMSECSVTVSNGIKDLQTLGRWMDLLLRPVYQSRAPL